MIAFAPEAQRDLDEAIDYLLARSPAAAVQLRRALDEMLARLDSGLLEGPIARLKSQKTVRSWPLRPWRIYYQRLPGGVLWVVRIYHQRRRPLSKRR